jgi:hypothetical protein
LNPQGDSSPENETTWRQRLGTAFNLVRPFDAHAARYDERRKLLESLLQVDDINQDRIRHVLDAMASEWNERREEATEAIMEFLEKALLLRVRDPIDSRDERVPSRKKRKQAELRAAYFEKLVALESECLRRLLIIYRHHLIEPDIDPAVHQGLDLEMAETWRKWGLNRWQLVAAGAVTGGTAGAMFDVGVGAHSLGAGTVIGAIGGGTVALLKGGSLPELRMKIGRGIRLSTGEGRTLVVGPPASPNFPWVLLDSMLLRYRGLLERAHGRRDPGSIHVERNRSIAQQILGGRRRLLQRWFTSCLKGRPDPDCDPDVFMALRDSLGEMEERRPT